MGQQPPDGSEINYRSVWEGKNPYLDMEFASEVSALRRYGQISVANWDIAVVPFCAKGNSTTAVWDCVLGSTLFGPSPHSEIKRILNSILGTHLKSTFF